MVSTSFGGANGSDAPMHGVQLDHQPADERPSARSPGFFTEFGSEGVVNVKGALPQG
jgi:hypothetical protein